MLDDDDTVACVHETLQDFEQACRIGGMQTRGRFVKQVEGTTGRASSQFLGEFDALGFAAGKRSGRLTELQIPQADIGHDLQA